MALVPSDLQASLNAAFTKAKNDKTSQAQANLCQDLATAFDTYIKSATITVATGIPVATAGTAVAQTGATTAPGTGTLS
jgi:hypothetical protein